MKITTIVVFVITIQRIFSNLGVSANALHDCYSGFVDSCIFIHKCSRFFLLSKGLLCLYGKQMIVVACRYGISLLVFNLTSHSFAALTRELSSQTLEEKFHTYARPSIILYLNVRFEVVGICSFVSCNRACNAGLSSKGGVLMQIFLDEFLHFLL